MCEVCVEKRQWWGMRVLQWEPSGPPAWQGAQDAPFGKPCAHTVGIV